MKDALFDRTNTHAMEVRKFETKRPLTHNHPCMVYIYLHEWLIFMVNVGKYTSPMDGMGKSRETLFVGKGSRKRPFGLSRDEADDNGWMARATHGHYVWALVG